MTRHERYLGIHFFFAEDKYKREYRLLFVLMDKVEEHKDIRNIANVEQVVERETKDKLMNNIKSRQKFKGKSI